MSQTTERFDLHTRIAIGNAGLVYRATEKATRRSVALKLLLGDELAYPLDGPAIVRDAGRLRQVYANNIARLLEVIEDEDGVVLAYEFADGLNWAGASIERLLDAAEALDVSAQLISAVMAGEGARLPHGELKPSNLVLTRLPDGRSFVWVLDWGLASYRAEPPPDAWPFLAPEQLAGGRSSTQADLFAAGVALVLLLTGSTPVGGATRAEIAAGWPQFSPEVLKKLRPDLPPKYLRWLATLLEVDPRKRPATARQAREALARLNPPAPPVLPEVFRPRVKPPARATPPRAARPKIVARPRVRAVPRVIASPEGETASADELPEFAESGEIVDGLPAADEPVEADVEPLPEMGPPEFEETASDPAAAGAETDPPALGTPADATLPEELPAPAAGAATEWPTADSAGEAVAAPPPAPRGAGRWRSAILAGAVLLLLAGSWLFLQRPRQPPGTVADSSRESSLEARQPPGLLSAEKFDYATGAPLQGQTGGSGWTGPWIAQNATVRAGSLVAGSAAPTSSGAHLEIVSKGGSTIKRPMGASPLFFDQTKGGVWWFSLLIAHSVAPKSKAGELQFNVFTAGSINDVMRLVIAESGGRLTLRGPNVKRPAMPLPGSSAEVKRLVGRVNATPAGAGKFDVTLDLWANPSPEIFSGTPPKAALNETVRTANFSPKLGLMLQVKPATNTSTTLLDEVRFSRTPAELFQ